MSAKIIANAMQKGGVGKSTSLFNKAHVLAAQGEKVLVVDNDPQGNVSLAAIGKVAMRTLTAHTKSLYENHFVEPIVVRKNLHLIGANKDLSTVQDKGFAVAYNFADTLDKYRDRYDYILIDCLPSLNTLLMSSLLAADYVLIPLLPEPFALDGLYELLETIKTAQRTRLNPKLKILGIFFNKVPGTQTSIVKEIMAGVEKNFKELLFKSYISKAIVAAESPTQQKPVFEYKPKHKIVKQYKEVTNELVQRIKKIESIKEKELV